MLVYLMRQCSCALKVLHIDAAALIPAKVNDTPSKSVGTNRQTSAHSTSESMFVDKNIMMKSKKQKSKESQETQGESYQLQGLTYGMSSRRNLSKITVERWQTSYVMSFCLGGRWMFLTTHFTIHSMPSFTPSLYGTSRLFHISFNIYRVWNYLRLTFHWKQYKNTWNVKTKAFPNIRSFWI